MFLTTPGTTLTSRLIIEPSDNINNSLVTYQKLKVCPLEMMTLCSSNVLRGRPDARCWVSCRALLRVSCTTSANRNEKTMRSGSNHCWGGVHAAISRCTQWRLVNTGGISEAKKHHCEAWHLFHHSVKKRSFLKK